MGHSLQPLKTPPKGQKSTLEHSESRKIRARFFDSCRKMTPFKVPVYRLNDENC